MHIEIPEKVAYIISELTNRGFEAYAVGGCVRDAILHRDPEDWDITTSAKPEEVKAVFSRTVDTGIEHGTVTVLVGSDTFEVTTFRLDGEYEDCRHPKKVSFTGNLREDLCRRDFTINAMAYNEEQGVIDLYEGMEDINRKLIRCVGSAEKRFDEDALRILRAVRFSAQLGFHIDDETRKAAEIKAKNLKKISAERIRVELTKLIISPHPDRLKVAYELHITSEILPEIDILEREGLLEYTIRSIECINELAIREELPKKTRVMLAFCMLLHKMKISAKVFLQRLKFDNDTIYTVKHLLEHLNDLYEVSSYGLRLATNKIGKDNMMLFFLIKRACLMAEQNQRKELSSNEKPDTNRNVSLLSLEEEIKLFCELVKLDYCTSLKELKLKGTDLIELGMKPGKEIGDTLELLLQEVIKSPEMNDTDKLKDYIKRTIL